MNRRVLVMTMIVGILCKAELAVKNFSHAIRICSIDGFAIVAVAFAYTVL